MEELKHLHDAANLLWLTIKKYDGILKDEPAWARFMTEIENIYTDYKTKYGQQFAYMVLKWFDEYMAYVDKREGRLIHLE